MKMFIRSIVVFVLVFVGLSTGRDVPVHANEISVAYSMRPPFVTESKNGALTGLDVLIVENFARKFNFRIKYVKFNSSLNEMFNRNANSENYLLRSNLQKIDVFMGALSGNSFPNNQFVASRSYYHDVLTWCIQKTKPLPYWRNMLRICNDPILLSVYTIMCFSVVLTAYFMQRFEDLQPKWDWLRLSLAGLSPCFGFASEYNPKIIPNRILFIACVFGAMLINIVANCIGILFVTMPMFDNQISTIHEISANGFDLSGDGFALQHVKQQNREIVLETIEHFSICENLEKCLGMLNQNPNLAVGISREHAITGRSNAVPFIYCFEESEIVYDYSLMFLMNTLFPYQKELNEFIQQASASGLIEKWRTMSQIRSNYDQTEKEYGTLKMEQIYLFVQIFVLFDLSLSLLLLFEWIVHKQIQNCNSFGIWKFVEMLIDPYRRFWLESKCYWK